MIGSGQSFSVLTGLHCPRCGRDHDADSLVNICECGSPLLATYDTSALASRLDRDSLRDRPPTLWRYHELLPVREQRHVTSLGEGMTPLLPLPRYGASIDLPGLLAKDEGLIPTGTFKARGAAVGVSRAAELGVKAIAMPSNGNAGAAWATYAARAGLGATVVMPQDAPPITFAECAVTGAQLYLVRGLIGDAGRIVARLVASGAAFDASTLKEPYRLEGKKTMGLEIVEQLGWSMPDVIVYPTGGGVGIIGIHKALAELRELGWVHGNLPRLVSVQATGCAPIVRAYEEDAAESTAWPDGRTVAFGINVGKALGDFLILDAIRETGGTAVAVDDAESLTEQATCARLDGLFCCPEAAAALAGVRRLRDSGWLRGDERVVVLNTGAGLKYPTTVDAAPAVLDPDDNIPTR